MTQLKLHNINQVGSDNIIIWFDINVLYWSLYLPVGPFVRYVVVVVVVLPRESFINAML